MQSVTWVLKAGTADYLSECGKYIAVYIRTERGYALYETHLATLSKSKRRTRDAYSRGGLPTKLP